jgi:hypothetical protein
MRSISVSVAMISLLCSCASTQPPAASSATAAGAQSVSKRFALVGRDGVVVEVLDLQDGEALIRVSGAESPLQNKVLSHRRGKDAQDLRYTTQWAGREWLTLLRSGDSSWIGTYWRLYLPGGEAIPVAYSEERSEQVDADSLFAAHEQQRRAGELEQLQRFSQSSERGEQDETVSTSAGVASRECGSTLEAAIAWDTVSDQALREHSVSDYCISALRALQSACYSSPELKSFIQKEVRDVSCRFDGSGEMSLNAGHLTWSMNISLGDLDTLASKAFTRIYLPGEAGSAAAL